MKIWHRISINSSSDRAFFGEIKKEGINYVSSPIPDFSGTGKRSELVTFEVSEDDKNWSKISALIDRHKPLDIISTSFEKEEIIRAKFLRLIPTYQRGYPQPEGRWIGDQTKFYDDFCTECGTYKRQIRKFRIKSEPKLRGNSFMGLFWTYALFAVSEVFSRLKVERMTGWERWNVVLNKTNEVSQVISQLYLSQIAKAGLEKKDNLRSIVCPECKQIKYHPHNKGIMYMNKESLDSGLDFQLSAEWFGSGHSAFREIIVSNRLARLILGQDWKGVQMKVIEV